MSTAPLKARVLDSMAAVLRPAGFRKRGSVFERSVANVVHLVSLQSSASSTVRACRVTVNLAVWVPRLHPTRNPDVWDSPWQQRLGSVMSEPGDRWWPLESDASADSAADEIRSALTRFGLPALDALSSESALLELWRSGKGTTAGRAADLIRILGGESTTG
ncbi:MAG: hypothetical protein HMLKMBBP_01637 [Planctomycetes bacterium]|nr:hypothetical protein [Planctomycetota bacterium]